MWTKALCCLCVFFGSLLFFSYLPHLWLFLLMPLQTSVCFLTFVLRSEGLNFIVLELVSEEKSNYGLPSWDGIMKQKWTILPLRDKDVLWLDLNCRSKVWLGALKYSWLEKGELSLGLMAREDAWWQTEGRPEVSCGADRIYIDNSYFMAESLMLSLALCFVWFETGLHSVTRVGKGSPEIELET